MYSPISDIVLQQLSSLIQSLKPAEYAQPLPVFNGSSIGGHTRHVIEFYDCLLKGSDTGIVNYDARQRDLEIQKNRDYALEVIKNLRHTIQKSTYSAKELYLESTFGDTKMSMPTCFEREEVYLIEHAIHHFALIRIGVGSIAPQVHIAPDFGIAFSTLEYRNKQEKNTTLSSTNQVTCVY
jgi:hypothetical protein